MTHCITNDGNLFFHTKQADADAEKHSRESNLEATAKALILNFSGHKGSGDNVYIEQNGKKVNVKDVSLWLDDLDKNKDGVITKEEVKSAGGDKFNILKLDASQEAQQKLSKDIYREQVIGGMKGMRKGLDTPKLAWVIAKPIIKNIQVKKIFLEC